MKKIHSLIMLIFLTGQLYAQQDFVPGRIIIKFLHNALDTVELSGSTEKYDKTNLRKLARFAETSDAFASLHGAMELKKLMPNVKPANKIVTASSGKPIPLPDLYNYFILETADSADIEKLCRKVRKIKGVELVMPDYYFEYTDSPANDSHYNTSQKSLEQTNDVDIDAARAWDFSVGGNGNVRIAIIDSGIDYDHHDLGASAYTKVAGGFDYFSNDQDFDDESLGSHGTSVAGIIGATRNNNLGVAGIAGGNSSSGILGAKLFALKVSGENNSIPSLSLLIKAMHESVTNIRGFSCNVVNCSFASVGQLDYDTYVTMKRTLKFIKDTNAVLVGALGNNSKENAAVMPAGTSPYNVIAVGASSGNDTRMASSNFGRNLDVVAPGDPEIVYTTKRTQENNYGKYGGTSAAAAHVSGRSCPDTRQKAWPASQRGSGYNSGVC